MKILELLPAIDIKNGRSVRLKQAGLDSAEQFGSPAEVLADFIAKGAKWVHLVDLDSAFNTGSNAGLFKGLIDKSSINIQLSGGIIDESSLNLALATKAVRINISTAALQNIDWVVRVINSHKDRLTIGLDISDGVLVARGSGEVIGDPFEYIKVLDKAGCMRYVVTDNSTDGELNGPNLDLLDKVSKSTKSLIIASGGVSKLSDLDNLRQMGLDGVIVGKALYVGAIDISLAIKTCYQ
jgi:1-(5-phosphoribosyl)-5-[(5-phosphoribosylamino)methylideneamino] imidazole-4-carboxamide isomerase/N-(5'phosphoribosyl)anthranilate isomerase